MARDQPPSPRPEATPQAIAERAAREQREAAALRANLQKRKQQARQRAAAGDRTDNANPRFVRAAVSIPQRG